MTVKPLYKYGNAVTPRRRGQDDPIHGYRLIADDGMMLTNGTDYVECIDISTVELDNWQEIAKEE